MTVPVVLPEVLAVVDDTGQVRIAVENIDHASIDAPIGPVDRRRLGAVLASIAEQVGAPVRVEVRDSPYRLANGKAPNFISQLAAQ